MQTRKISQSVVKLTAAIIVVSVGVALAISFSSDASVAAEAALKVEGDYIEARTCDVWTGPCFSNGEINIKGDHGVMGWVIRKGTWQGVRLDGLKVAASIDAEGTLGSNAEGKVRAVVYLDKRANKTQGRALLAVVKELAPKYLQNIVKVYTDKKITYRRQGSTVDFQVGREVVLRTRALSLHCDIICGNEEKAYSSLASTRHAECAKTVAHVYRGNDLGQRWSDPGARSAMVGSFALPLQNLVNASR